MNHPLPADSDYLNVQHDGTLACRIELWRHKWRGEPEVYTAAVIHETFPGHELQVSECTNENPVLAVVLAIVAFQKDHTL